MRRFWALLILFVLGLATAVYLLRIDEVKVEGLTTLSPRTIIEASGLEPGERILWERLSVAERKIEAIPSVADAVAERSLPSTVILRVIEREPIAVLDSVPQLAVDAEGVMFPTDDDRRVPAKLYGWKGKPTPGGRLDTRSRTVLEAFGRFPDVIRTYARRLKLSDDGFDLTLSGGTEVRFGLLRDLEAKAQVATSIIRDERKRDGTIRLAYIDVRSPTVPVSRRVPTPTPVPSAAPQAPVAPAPTAAPSLTP